MMSLMHSETAIVTGSIFRVTNAWKNAKEDHARKVPQLSKLIV